MDAVTNMFAVTNLNIPIWKDVIEASDRPELNYVQTELISIASDDPKFSIVQSKIPFPVSKVFHVQNPKLYARFLLKKEQYSQPEIRELFHDTEIHNQSSILSSNLDWRRATRVKYGQGVSFATTAGYAYKYSNGFNTEKMMIICDVLVEKMRVYLNRNHPPSDVDTTVSADNNVIVKYCDDEFYPKFLAYYTGPVKQNRFDIDDRDDYDDHDDYEYDHDDDFYDDYDIADIPDDDFYDNDYY